MATVRDDLFPGTRLPFAAKKSVVRIEEGLLRIASVHDRRAIEAVK